MKRSEPMTLYTERRFIIFYDFEMLYKKLFNGFHIYIVTKYNDNIAC